MILRAWLLWCALGGIGVALYAWRFFSGWYDNDEELLEHRRLFATRPLAYVAVFAASVLLGCLLGPCRLAIELAAKRSS
jgi:hypothetical protein